MQAQVDIEFEQLVKLAKQLPTAQWKKLKKEGGRGICSKAEFGFGFITFICTYLQ